MSVMTMPEAATRDQPATTGTMKALVYLGPGKKALEERRRPGITAPTDAIVKIIKTTICGTDLHILKGDVPTCKPGRILGHEGVGIIEKVGPAVTACMVARLLLWQRAIARDLAARTYTDLALTPVSDDDDTTLDLFTKTTGARAAVAHVKRVAELTAVGRIGP
jgi:hypothetical protein